MQGHAFSFDVRTGSSVERYWVIAQNPVNALAVLKKIGLSSKAVIEQKDQIPDRYARELGLDLAAIGTHGHRDA